MYIIGITGKSCSGKTTLAKKLHESLGGDASCLLLSMDDYYNELNEDQYKILHNDASQINFDTPDAINLDLLKSNLVDIKSKKFQHVRMPKFDLASCKIVEWKEIETNKYKYLVIEGLFVFTDSDIAKLCNLKLWVETSDYICALRRFIKFTCNIKGYTADYVYNQCIKYVIPGQEKYIKPMKIVCDFFINGEKEDANSIEMIASYAMSRSILI